MLLARRAVRPTQEFHPAGLLDVLVASPPPRCGQSPIDRSDRVERDLFRVSLKAVPQLATSLSARPATALTLPGAASQIARIEMTLHPVAIQNATK
jgi:hypothetical protein